MNKRSFMVRRNSKNLIVQNALGLFSKNGFDNTSIRDIAKQCDISIGLMYNYFKGKEDLLKCIFNEGLQDIQDSFLVPEGSIQPKQRFEFYVRQTFKIIEEKKELWRLIHSIRMQKTIMALLVTDMQKMQHFILENLTSMLNDLKIKDPEKEAFLLFAIIDGIAGHYLINASYPLQETVNKLINKYT